MSKSNRQTRREQARRKQQRSQWFLYGGIAAVVLVVVGVILISANNSAASSPTSPSTALMGDPVPVLSRDHIPVDTDPGPYNSNPPAAGHHFPVSWPAKFYQESDLATLPKFPQGYLVHSLEHGYVIFWYNCQAPNTDCAALKQDIQKVMDATGGTKLIAFPWTTMDIPLAMTSWGRVMKFPKPDTSLMQKFVQTNRYQSPEPDGP